MWYEVNVFLPSGIIFLTIVYLHNELFSEVEGKDTPSKIVLERTYQPRLMSFEEEIMTDMGIIDERKPKPTYWY